MITTSSPMLDLAAERVDRSRLAAVAAISVPLATLSLPLVVFLPEFHANALASGMTSAVSIFSRRVR
jgi:hypothetical protein